MEQRGPQVTETQVEAFERSYGHRLPDDYRQFLLEVNSGSLDQENCEFDPGVVNCLFSLDDTEDDASDLATRANRSRSSLPDSSLLPIGQDDGGARLLLVLAGEHRGGVWLMYTTDARPEGANPRVAWHDRRDMHKLAGSFEQFLLSLRPLK